MLSLNERLNLFQLLVFFVLMSPLTRLPAVACCSAMMMASADGGSSPRQTNNERINKRTLTFPNAIVVSNNDIHTFVRQTGQVAPSLAVLGVPARSQCQHGFAQVFVLDPLPSNSSGNNNRMNSGLLKLTCPILVRAVDDLEDQGMIFEFNQQLAADATWQHEVLSAHEIHATARQNMLSKADLQLLQARLGPTESDFFLRAGVAGTSPESKDMKCLHAWLADYLFRCTNIVKINEKDNGLFSMGDSIVEKLGGTYILKGNADCHVFCDPNTSFAVQPPKARNKQRLKSKRESKRRKRRKNENS